MILLRIKPDILTLAIDNISSAPITHYRSFLMIQGAVKLFNQYGLSHNMTIYDAIIASTCIIYDIKLWTYHIIKKILDIWI